MENFKGYVYTIFSGLLLLAGVLFVALQWGNHSRITAFGPAYDIRTIWLVLGSAAGGIVTLYVVRLFLRGVWILHRVRSAQRKISAQVAAQTQADQPAPKPAPDSSPREAESDNPLSPS